MIAQLKGKWADVHLEKDTLRAILDVQGVGYEVLLAKSAEELIKLGNYATVYIQESVTPFDGITTLYGFLSLEEKDFFKRIREKVDGMGPKKALECLDKIQKSLPDFKRAIIDNDLGLLVSVFGFTKKTAEKLLAALKGQADQWVVTGPVKWSQGPKTIHGSEALSGLINLGYREEEARNAIEMAQGQLGKSAKTEEILKFSLRLLASPISNPQ